ncbi:MAG: branched-chain amino acid ABC transporter permease [Afipia sp.]|nr:branched-chain amino acid ABC transporter permease [Afipia sp.]
MSDYVLTLIGNAALLSMLAVSVYLVLLAGELSFGHQGFFGVGAYCAALATAGYDLHPLLGIGAAIIAGAFAGVVLAVLTIPLKGLTFLLSTLAFGEMVRTGLGLWYFDPDGAGPKSGPTGVEGYSDLRFIFDSGLGLEGATLFVVLALALVMIGTMLMERTHWGVRVRAIGQDQALAEALGLRVIIIKIIVITLSAALAGFVGAMFAFFATYIEPANFSVMLGIHTLAYALIGGVGHVAAVFIGVGLDLIVLQAVRGLAEYRMIIFGGCIALLLRYRPGGVLDIPTVLAIKKRLRGTL